MHEKLIGVPHTTVRFWDLRYFFDSRTYNQTGFSDIPLPDRVAVNGEVAKKQYINGGYAADKLVDVEALRFLHLEKFVKRNNGLDQSGQRNTLLVITDYMTKNIALQMSLLQQASKMTDKKIEFIIKPHPHSPVLVEDYPDMEIKITNTSIDKLLDCCTMVFTSSLTSAAVEAFYAGKHVITFVDASALNRSPLKGYDGVSFVSTADELAQALNNIDKINSNIKQEEDYFYIDRDLPRWRNLLMDE